MKQKEEKGWGLATLGLTRQSRQDSGLGFQIKVLKPFTVGPSSLGSGPRAACFGIAPAFLAARGVWFRVWGIRFGV